MIGRLFLGFQRFAQGSGLKVQLIRAGAAVGIFKGIQLLLMFLVSVLLARGLGPKNFGVYSFVITIILLISLPVGQGIQQLMTREVSGYAHTEDWSRLLGLWRRMQLWVVAGFLFGDLVIVCVGINTAAWTSNDPWTLLVFGAMGPLCWGLSMLRSGVLRGLGRVIHAQVPVLLARPGFQLLVVVTLLAMGRLNALTAVGGLLVGMLASLVISASLLKREWPREACNVVPEYESRRWLIAWGPFTLLMATGMMNTQIGILMLGWLGTNEQVAALRVADRGAQLVAMSLMIVNMVVAPYITRAYREGARNRLQKLSTQSARAAAAIGVPIGLIFIIWGGSAIRLAFGSDYVATAATPLAILAAGQCVNVAFGNPGLFLMMSGHERDSLIAQLVAISFNVIIAVVLIPRQGAEGAAIAAASAIAIRNAGVAFSVWRRLGLKPAFC